jgi:hypothetical protein
MIRRYTAEQYAEALFRNGGNRNAAADELGVSHHTMWVNTRKIAAPSPSLPPRLPLHPSPVELQATIDDLRGQLEAVTMVKRWAAKPSKRTTPKPSGAKHLYIPDTQVKLGVPINHLEAAGHYAVEKRPDVIVLAGDWWDFPSLSSYDRGKLSFEGRRYRSDVEAGKAGLEKFLAPIRKAKKYNPRIVMTLGNHEARVLRAIQEHSILDGTIGLRDLQLEAFGVEEHEFLKPVVIDGVAYCHFFPRAASGKVMQDKNGAPNALAQLRREGRSCVAGHTQGFDIACLPYSGKLQWGIQAGSFYQHQEKYLTPQGQDHWHGIVVLHEVRNGCFNPMVVSLDYLLAEYQ